MSSGLAGLPLKYIWFDGKENTLQPTDPYLPTGEPLNGSLAYSNIMSYFTTNNMTAMDVHELGKKQLDILYPMVVDVAKLVTGINDTNSAISEFREILTSSDSYFNADPFPQNESDKEAHKKCSDIEGAKKHCPTRWAALELWMAESRKVFRFMKNL